MMLRHFRSEALHSARYMKHFNLRMPQALFEELSRQAGERGLSVGAFVRTQLSATINNPINIHKTH